MSKYLADGRFSLKGYTIRIAGVELFIVI